MGIAARPGGYQGVAGLGQWLSASPYRVERLMSIYRPVETAWFGPRRVGGRYDALAKVSDTVLHEYFAVGGGS